MAVSGSGTLVARVANNRSLVHACVSAGGEGAGNALEATPPRIVAKCHCPPRPNVFCLAAYFVCLSALLSVSGDRGGCRLASEFIHAIAVDRAAVIILSTGLALCTQIVLQPELVCI